jgi:hypothetical protein
MKTFPKILTAIFVFLFIFQTSAFLFINLAPNANASDLNFKPQVTVGEFDKDNTKGYLVKGDTEMIGAYIKSIYEYAIGIAGIVAAAVLMYGGFSYLMSGGSADKISNAKSWIGAALSGLVLVMLSYTILSIINPKLLDFKISPIEEVDPLELSESSTSSGCCQYSGEAKNEKEEDCKGTWKGADYVAVSGVEYCQLKCTWQSTCNAETSKKYDYYCDTATKPGGSPKCCCY